MKFKIGQEVVCVKTDGWKSKTYNHHVIGWGPRYREIVTVTGYVPNGSIQIKEWPFTPCMMFTASFAERCFEPLMDISELKEVLNYELTPHP